MTETDERVRVVDELLAVERAKGYDAYEAITRLFEDPQDELAEVEGGEYVSVVDLIRVIWAHQVDRIEPEYREGSE